MVVAEAANPEWASVPLVGWSHARALAEVADVHLVTQVRNREAILRAENLHADEATVFEVEDYLWKVLVIERNRDRDSPP